MAVKKHLFNWEFWPTYMFYIPLLPLYFYYALKSGSLTYFTATNPAIKNGGDATESKFDTLKLLPKNLIPRSVFVPKNQALYQVLNDLKANDMSFPLIIKPDIGYRGLLVKKLLNNADLESFLKTYTTLNFIIQEFIAYPNECGILYWRYPNKNKGQITSITLKKYLSVIGNGQLNIAELIQKDTHAKRYETLIESQLKSDWHTIPKIDTVYVLNEIGNHCKGAAFINGNHFISKQLTETFDKLNQNISGFYFGRFDIKYKDFESLKQGEHFKIIELNGVIAEPTHIYDTSKSSYWYCLKSLAKHWGYIYQISKINHRENGVQYKPFWPVFKGLLALRPYNKTIKKLSLN